MAHFIFRMPPTNDNMSAEEKIETLEGVITDLVQTLEYVLSHIDGDNLTSDIMERIKEDKK